jgi:hypothetical protein
VPFCGWIHDPARPAGSDVAPDDSPNTIVWRRGSWVVSRDELLRRFAALPGTFPQTKRYATELTAGTGHDRFDFTIGLMIDGLAHR